MTLFEDCDPNPIQEDEPFLLLPGDCRKSMALMAEESVDALVSDPPYGLSFMGKGWDKGVPGVDFWRRAYRVLKPGAHLLAFSGSRTYHHLAVGIEDAGFEIRDCLSWLYGSGFPKNHDVSKAIDKTLGAKRKKVGERQMGRLAVAPGQGEDRSQTTLDVTEAATKEAQEWEGWGTALKPAWEPIILARKPLRGTVAKNVMEHGTGAMNIEGCRVGSEGGAGKAVTQKDELQSRRPGWGTKKIDRDDTVHGRYPANVVLDEEAARLLDEQSGNVGGGGPIKGGGPKGTLGWSGQAHPGFADQGGASRFFYTAKASGSERNAQGKNPHPTVKPVDLMRWCCRLVTPPKGLVLDPFMGSGSTGVAALAEGFFFVGCELDPEMVEVARRRIAGALFA